ELHQRRLVDLQIAASGLCQRAHFLRVGLDQIGPEGVEIAIDLAADIGAAGAIVDVAGAGQGDLGCARGRGLEEARVVGVLGPGPGDGVDDLGDAARHAVAVALRAGPALILRQLDLHAGNAGAGERVGIGPAPELAVGDDVEPNLLLQRDHAAD